MANSTQPESKAETALSKSLLDSFKTKEKCPRCKEEYLQTAYVSHELRRRRYVEQDDNSKPKREKVTASSAEEAQPYDVPYGSDASSLVEIMNHKCMNCGFAFYESEQQQERRKEQDKDDKRGTPIESGFLILFAMLAVILAINLDRSADPPLNSQPAVIRNDSEF